MIESSDNELLYREVNFDLEISKLKQFYPNKNWRKAWDDIRRFLENNGFNHALRSGYISERPMTIVEAEGVIRTLKKELPWVIDCASAFHLTKGNIDRVDLTKTILSKDFTFEDETSTVLTEPERKPLKDLMADARSKADVTNAQKLSTPRISKDNIEL